MPLKFVPGSQINNKPTLIQIVAWYQTGNKSLSEPLVVKFIDAYIRRSVSMS